MAGPNARKRSHQAFGASKSKTNRPFKKSKKQAQYHSDSDEQDDANEGFNPVNLLDSDVEDLENAAVDDIDSSDEDDKSDNSGSELDPDVGTATIRQRKQIAQKGQKKSKSKNTANSDSSDDEEVDPARDTLRGSSPSSNDSDNDDDDDDEGSSDDEAQQSSAATGSNRSKLPKNKRNDPSAFATSMSKILSTKLSTSRREDPLLSRSADAQRAARELVDTALEARARRHLREQKRLASEKGRVRDVLTGATIEDELPGTSRGRRAARKGGVEAAAAAKEKEEAGGDGRDKMKKPSTGEIVATERRLRKTAHKGVIMLFRAVREAQERAHEAEDGARTGEGRVLGMGSRQEKVTEMSRQGFLDLIAGGGGKLKKGGLEEA